MKGDFVNCKQSLGKQLGGGYDESWLSEWNICNQNDEHRVAPRTQHCRISLGSGPWRSQPPAAPMLLSPRMGLNLLQISLHACLVSELAPKGKENRMKGVKESHTFFLESSNRSVFVIGLNTHPK